MAVFIFVLYACTLLSHLLCAYRLIIHNIFQWIYTQLCSVIINNVPVVLIYDNTKPQDCVTSCWNECVITVNKLEESFYIPFIFLFPGSEIFTEQGYELEFSSTHLSSEHSIVLKQGDTLNLTCKITSRSGHSLPRFKITIHTPYSSQNRYVSLEYL